MLRALAFPRYSERLSVIIALAVFVWIVTSASAAVAAPLGATSPSLGAAATFAILAGSKISNVPPSAITGDVGLSPTTGAAITGFTCSQVSGTIYSVDIFPPLPCHAMNPGLLTTAKNDLITAYDGLAAGSNSTCTTDYGAGPQDLSLVSPLGPGVYCVGTNGFQLTKNLTLSGSGIWIFRSVTTIITSPGSSVTGGNPCHVWWRAETSATLDTTTSFVGNILALASITINTGATLHGRALARNGAVTLQANTITGPDCSVGPTATNTPVEHEATNTPVPSTPAATFTPSSTPGGPAPTPGGPTLTPGGPALTPVAPTSLPKTGASAGRDTAVPAVIGLATLAGLACYAGLRLRRRRANTP